MFLIPHHTVVIHRDGKNIRPPIGQPFDFTLAEAEELYSLHPTCLRRPVQEMGQRVTAAAAEVTSETDDAPAAVRKAGRKAATPITPATTAEDDDEL